MPTNHPAPYPLTFVPLLYDKVWGGDRLARLGKPVKAGAKVGESWELADLGQTSASGAGGGAARSVIASGALAGKSLHDAITAWGHNLLGAARLADDASGVAGAGGFPLLIKFLDARENLSVQVHPSPAYAARHPSAKLKTECWYILDAEPGAVIYKGLRPGLTAGDFRAHIADGTVHQDMIAVPAVVGECHNLPSGTVHALGAGVVVAEVQTPSDTTFRVFDWGRAGRELHVEQALACIDFPPAPPPHATRLPPGHARARLVTTSFFTLDELRVPAGVTAHLADAGGSVCYALIGLSGTGVLSRATGAGTAAFEPVTIEAGLTTLVPAAVADRTEIKAQTEMRVLKAMLV
jgi:mannose-6-phosphate isomerase